MLHYRVSERGSFELKSFVSQKCVIISRVSYKLASYLRGYTVHAYGRWMTPLFHPLNPLSIQLEFIMVFCSSKIIHHHLLLFLWQSERCFLRESPLASPSSDASISRSPIPLLPQCRALLVRINLSPTSLQLRFQSFVVSRRPHFMTEPCPVRIRSGNEAARSSVQDRSQKLEVTTF